MVSSEVFFDDNSLIKSAEGERNLSPLIEWDRAS
jgi:hypothetical protein